MLYAESFHLTVLEMPATDNHVILPSLIVTYNSASLQAFENSLKMTLALHLWT
jgi:hypothetical protein